MRFSDLTELGKETFLTLVAAAFCNRAEELGWILKGFDEETGIATFEKKEDKAKVIQVNLLKLIADIIYIDSDFPELGEASLEPTMVTRVLNTRLAILDAIGRCESEEELKEELRKIGQRFRGRLRYWRGEEGKSTEDVMKETPSLWLQNGKEVQ